MYGLINRESVIMFNWTVADWLQASYISITALGVVVTGFMAFWVANTIQRKIDNERTLKDFYVSEIKALREEARSLINHYVVGGSQTAEQMKTSHFVLQTHINDLLRSLRHQYAIGNTYMQAYKSGVLTILEKDSNFIASFKDKSVVSLSDESKKSLRNLEMKNDHLFGDLILKVYGKE